MGCDIHMFCEKLITVNDVSRWRNVDHFQKNHWDNDMEVVELCGNRDYSMFTALCGVRDYSEESPKISEPKGLPKNVCRFVKEEFDKTDGDNHSTSFVTLREVREFNDKAEDAVYSGLITPHQAKLLDEQDVKPSSWFQGSSNSEMVHRKWEVKGQPLMGLFELMANRANQWLFGDLSRLDDDDLDNFRIVFWFDN